MSASNNRPKKRKPRPAKPTEPGAEPEVESVVDDTPSEPVKYGPGVTSCNGRCASSKSPDPSCKFHLSDRGRGQSVTAWLPMYRPNEDASDEIWYEYFKEKFRRKTEKAKRNGRIARREEPHDVESCEVCKAVPKRDLEINVAEAAKKSKVSRSHFYRTIDRNIADRRMIGTLLTARRMAHDGLGISVDELIALAVD